ncbi:MAG: DUF2927 domain-containing protein [Sedimenticola sp.]
MAIARRWISRLLLIGIFFSTTGFNWLDEDYLVRGFEEIALKAEYQQGKTQPLRKWLQPVRIYIDSRAGLPKIQQRLVDEHIATLNHLIDHPIQRVDDKSDANMVILFELSGRLSRAVGDYYERPPFSEQLLDKSVCVARLHATSMGEIRRVFIAIPPDKARNRAKLPACVIEEITQGLGLPNDSDNLFPSIFNDKSVFDELTPLDKMFLQVLYDQRLKPGMDVLSVRPLVRTIVRERLQAIRREQATDQGVLLISSAKPPRV